MTENQKKLEELLLRHIEDRVYEGLPDGKDTVAPTAMALLQLWREKGDLLNQERKEIMYIHPFICGVIATILLEIIAAIIYAVTRR